MNKCEELALGQAIKEMVSMASIVSKVSYFAGYQELQSQFATKILNLNEVFKEINEVKHDTK